MRGLIVGKFSPLHQGHEALVRFALSKCDELHLLTYSKPEFEGCAAPMRRHWLTTTFPSAIVHVAQENLPDNDAPDLEHREFVKRFWEKHVGRPLDVVFTSEAYGDGFASHIGVKHVSFDPARSRVPVSGTAIRADLFGHRQFLSPVVYRSFLKTVCFLGGESTGKTTLTKEMAKRFDTAGVDEYGRELWEAKGGTLVYEDMIAIAREHVRREDEAILRSRRFLFVDTSPLTTLLYSRHLFDKIDEELTALSHRRYDHTFLCAPDFPFVQDGTRAGDDFRHLQHARYLKVLDDRKIPYTLLQGSLENRIATITLTLR